MQRCSVYHVTAAAGTSDWAAIRVESTQSHGSSFTGNASAAQRDRTFCVGCTNSDCVTVKNNRLAEHKRRRPAVGLRRQERDKGNLFFRQFLFCLVFLYFLRCE